MNSNRFAAIDCGSNTFRMLIAEPSGIASKPWRTVHYEHRIVRLGEGLHHSGRLCEPAMARALAAFRDFAAALKIHGVAAAQLMAAATAAMREAENGAAFAEQVLAETGIKLNIIHGNTEAEWSLAGACAVLDQQTQADFMLFDIGGGSTEFVRAQGAHHRDAISRKLGVVRLVEAHLKTDPPSAEDYTALLAAADTHLAEVEAFWGDGTAPKHLVGTAGTITTLAATALDLCPYDADVINNFHMSLDEFLALRDRLLALNHNERANIRTIEPGRADLLVAGLAIIEAVMRRWNYSEIISVDAGLLEGAWLQASQKDN